MVLRAIGTRIVEEHDGYCKDWKSCDTVNSDKKIRDYELRTPVAARNRSTIVARYQPHGLRRDNLKPI